MNEQFFLTPKARSDLDDIWNYTLSQWGSKQAEKYVRDLWVDIQAQVSDFSASTDIGHIRKGYRKISSGSHVIFFRIIDNHRVEVIRILHQQMDFVRHI